jgi:hypothetical protein
MVSFPPAGWALMTSVVGSGHARNLAAPLAIDVKSRCVTPFTRLLRDRGSGERLAEVERIERGYLSSVVRLTLLTPDLVEAIVDGRPPESLDLLRLLAPFPMEWSAQPSALAAGAAPSRSGLD